MGCSLHDNRLHCSVAIFFCPVLQFRGFDVTSERGSIGARYVDVSVDACKRPILERVSIE